MSCNFSLSIFSYFFWRITTQRSDEKYTVQCEAVDKYLYMNHVGVLEAKSPWHCYKTHWIICLKLIFFFTNALGNGGIRTGVYNMNFPHRFFLQLRSGMLSQTPLKISQRKWIKIWKTGTLRTMFSLISPQVLTTKNVQHQKRNIFVVSPTSGKAVNSFTVSCIQKSIKHDGSFPFFMFALLWFA